MSDYPLGYSRLERFALRNKFAIFPSVILIISTSILLNLAYFTNDYYHEVSNRLDWHNTWWEKVNKDVDNLRSENWEIKHEIDKQEDIMFAMLQGERMMRMDSDNQLLRHRLKPSKF